MVEAKEDVNKMKAELAIKNQARGLARCAAQGTGPGGLATGRCRRSLAAPQRGVGVPPVCGPAALAPDAGRCLARRCRSQHPLRPSCTTHTCTHPKPPPPNTTTALPPRPLFTRHPPQELAVASREAEALLKSISESTAIAEKEKAKVAVIVGEVSTKAAEITAVKVRRRRPRHAARGPPSPRRGSWPAAGRPLRRPARRAWRCRGHMTTLPLGLPLPAP